LLGTSVEDGWESVVTIGGVSFEKARSQREAITEDRPGSLPPSAFVVYGHEAIGHAVLGFSDIGMTDGGSVLVENVIRAAAGMDMRISYGSGKGTVSAGSVEAVLAFISKYNLNDNYTINLGDALNPDHYANFLDYYPDAGSVIGAVISGVVLGSSGQLIGADFTPGAPGAGLVVNVQVQHETAKEALARLDRPRGYNSTASGQFDQWVNWKLFSIQHPGWAWMIQQGGHQAQLAYMEMMMAQVREEIGEE